jgi:hypothetical protein
MIYLLSSQALVDLLTGDPRMVKWIEDKPLQMIEVSAISIGQAMALIDAQADPGLRKELSEELDKLLLWLRRFQATVPFDDSAARTWATLMKMPNLMFDDANELSPEGRMVVAVALTRNAVLIDAPRPYHGDIPSLTVQSP